MISPHKRQTTSQLTTERDIKAEYRLEKNKWVFIKHSLNFNNIILKKNQGYDSIKILERNSDGSLVFRIIWTNIDRVRLSSILYYDSDREAKNDGWSF